MGAALAFRENTARVPGTPSSYSELVKEIRDHAKSLEVANQLQAFGMALQHYESLQSKSKDNHYFLVEVNHTAQPGNIGANRKPGATAGLDRPLRATRSTFCGPGRRNGPWLEQRNCRYEEQAMT
jgi:hypothetical protein